MNIKQQGYTSVAVAYLILVVLCAIGWIMNVVSIIHTIDMPISGLFILRCVGVVLFPLGVILGWFA